MSKAIIDEKPLMEKINKGRKRMTIWKGINVDDMIIEATNDKVILMTWHDLGIGTPNGPNDPFFGHLWVDGVMELLEMVTVYEKA